jgi:hypothetical protein
LDRSAPGTICNSATANSSSTVDRIAEGLEVEVEVEVKVEEVVPQETQPSPSRRCCQSQTVSPNRDRSGGDSSRLSPALCLNEFTNGARQLDDNLVSLTVAIHALTPCVLLMLSGGICQTISSRLRLSLEKPVKLSASWSGRPDMEWL